MMMPPGKTKWGWLLVGVALLAVPLCGFAGTEVRIVTSDGETLRGQLDADFLEIDTGMARKQIPLGDVLSANLREIKLRDGKVVRGKVLLKSVGLSTAAGRIVLEARQISLIEVIQPKAALPEAAPRPNPVKPVSARGTVSLSDGSQLAVEFPGESLIAETQSGSVQIPWSDIAETDLRQVRLRNGDTLKVRVTSKIKVKTSFGPLELTPDNIKSIRFQALAKRPPWWPWRSPSDGGHPPDNGPSPGDSTNLAGKLGLGIGLSVINLGIGPEARYWLTDSIAGQVGYIALGGFTGYNIRGLYAFKKPLELAGTVYRPYAGLGYMSAKDEKEYPMAGGNINVTVEGSGPEFFAGLHGNLLGWHPDVYWTTELLYAAVKLTGRSSSAGTTIEGTEDFSNFSIGASVSYYFSTPPLLGHRGGQ